MKFYRRLGPALAVALVSVCMGAQAQREVRLKGPIEGGPQVALTGSRPPRALAANDLGALSGDTAIKGMTLVFNRTAAQETALQTLLAAQQNPASPLYHQWLTPAQFGAQFGVSDADVATVESWLQGQGFAIERVSPAQDRISFSGTAAQVNAAFGTALHRYQNGDRVEYAPSTDLSLPSALAPMVSAVLHLNTFRPHPMVKRLPSGVKPAYTTAGTQEHFLTPKDLGTMYDVNSVYNSGFTGTGQTIAIAGETYIETSDVSDFETAVGLPANLPTMVLEPNTGGSAIYEGDEFESDIDVEYSIGMAPGANVLLVYVGDSPNYSTFDAFDYAIEENLAPVVSVSYGSCEPLLGSAYAVAGNALFEQGAAQGQTLIASAGDSGSTECFGYTDDNGNPLPAATQEQLAINYPADSPYVTSIGGTQMAAGTFTAGSSQYWQSAGSSSIANSLLSYVPEVVWNEDSTNFGFASGGGGASIYFTGASGPTYQTGVTGLSAGNTTRYNPDISFQASVESPGYLACSSDPSAFLTGQTTSCTNGIYDSTGKFVTQAGGTSFGAPVFAGLMAVLNQVKHGTGQGPVNPTLYKLAANSATYASAFHDITSGNNGCSALPADCSAGLNTFQAAAGYDEATGLGSVDFANLLNAWPASTASALAGTTVKLTPATASPALSASDVITIQVASTTGGTPTGTVTVYLANESTPALGSTLSTVPAGTVAATLTLNASGQATYTFPGTANTGTQIITAMYSGDATNAGSTSTLALTVANSLTPTGSFTFTVGSVSVPANGVGESTITVTPTGGYNGVINFTIPSLPAADCFATDYSAITTGAATTLTLYVGNGSVCSSTSEVRVGNKTITFVKRTASNVPPKGPWQGKPIGTMFAGLLAMGMLARRRARRLPMLIVVGVLALTAGLGLSGCGSGTGNVPNAPTGTTGSSGSFTLVGADSVTPSITYQTSFTVTVQ